MDCIVHGVAKSQTRLNDFQPMDGGAWQAAVHRVSESDTTEATKQRQHGEAHFWQKEQPA